MTSQASAKTLTIHDIPQDVLGYIFRVTLPAWDAPYDHDHNLYSDTLVSNKPPWTLASVSRQWRRIALEEKTLWSILRISLFRYDDKFNMDAKLTTLQLCLDRSGAAGLSIYFLDKVTQGLDGPTPIYLRVLMDHSSRWRRFSAYLNSRHFPQLNGIRGNISQLEELHFHPYVPNTTSYTMFENAPSLRILRLPKVENLFMFKLPLHQLEVLDLERKPSLRLNFLHLTPSLTELVLSHIFGRGDGDIPHPDFEHPGIRRLTTDCLDLLVPVKLPNLKTLVIDHPTCAVRVFVRVVTSIIIAKFLSQNKFKLTTLVLCAVKYRDFSSMSDIFNHLPHLIRLQIIETDTWGVPWDALIRILAETTAKALLPTLSHLDLQTMTGTSELFSINVIHKLVVMLDSWLLSRHFAARVMGVTPEREGNLRSLQGKILELKALEGNGWPVTFTHHTVPARPANPVVKSLFRNDEWSRNKMQILTFQSGGRSGGVYTSLFPLPGSTW